MNRHMDRGRISRREAIGALASAPALRLLRGQQIPTFSTNVKVVNLFATVRTRQGEIVADLSKEDFILKEDGRPQTIKYFARESDLPLTLGVLVDSSGSQRNVLDDESKASYRFFDQVLREQLDMAFVLHFQGQVELLQNLTSSRQQLEKALSLLGEPIGRQQQGYPGGGYPGRGRGGAGGGTSLYDAVWLSSNELMKKPSGRKALIILSDGVDNASRVTLQGAVEAAQRVDTLIYSILFSDPDAYGGGFGGFGGRGGGGGGGPITAAEGADNLDRLARQSGGRYFEVSKKRSISQVYEIIEEELRNLYNLGYTPDRESPPDIYHKIRLATVESGMSVQTRDGYYAA